MYVVYVLSSKIATKSYVGMTNDVSRRLVEHNSGKHVYTKRFVPWEVVYLEEQVSREAARKREKYFKSAAGRVFLKNNIFKN